MTTPTPGLVMPISDRDHRQGPDDAPVSLVEYGDYECPYCAAAHPIVKSVQRELGDQLLFVFRNFPLTEIHPHAETAATLAEAADWQGRFWPAHDALYENHEAVVAGDFEPIAEIAGLDTARSAQDMADPAIMQRVREDFMSGVRSGVNGTPTFFIDGVRYNGSWDHQHLLSALARRLRVA